MRVLGKSLAIDGASSTTYKNLRDHPTTDQAYAAAELLEQLDLPRTELSLEDVKKFEQVSLDLYYILTFIQQCLL